MEQYRLERGYQQMVDFLAETCRRQGCEILTNTEAAQIVWKANTVSVSAQNGKTYQGDKVVITVPLNILQKKTISFSPVMPLAEEAIQRMAMGASIKILLQFQTAFWLEEETAKRTGKNMEKVFFIFSDKEVPTWWTPYPKTNALLTGWLGGPKAEAWKDLSSEDILTHALQSLASIFKTTSTALQQQLAAWQIANWTADKYTCGSYSYATVATAEARQTLTSPIEDTIYFAGEALYDGPEMGTVEAALSSGKNIAMLINA
jgi:monoamine oxidase